MQQQWRPKSMSHNTTGRLAEPQPDGFGKAIAQLAVSHSSRALMHVLVLTNAANATGLLLASLYVQHTILKMSLLKLSRWTLYPRTLVLKPSSHKATDLLALMR